MTLKNPFKLEKMRIEAYTDVERKSPALRKSMEVMFNPESYQQTHELAFIKGRQPMNSPAVPARYSYTPPGELSLTFIIDSTGVSESFSLLKKTKSVNDQIKEFKDICLNMEGKIHQPPFLKICWGKALSFSCRIKTLAITYKLFDRGGEPIRAELDATFIHDESQEAINKKANKQSPDVTHLHTVKSGDTLPFLCKQIYGSQRHYLMIARKNNLDDFRNLTPGQQLVFPPLQNDERHS